MDEMVSPHHFFRSIQTGQLRDVLVALGTSYQGRGLLADELSDMLLVKVCFHCFLAPFALFEIGLFVALVQLVLVVVCHFDDLGAPCAVRKHQAVEHVMQVQFLAVSELFRLDITKLTHIF